MKRVIVFAAFLMCFFVVFARAEETPTVVFGEAATPQGGEMAVLVEQPENAPNPLGNPLPMPDNTAEESSVPVHEEQAAEVKEASPEGAVVSENNPVKAAQELGNDFQNTLTEANGRIYDIKSYPEADVGVMSNPSQPETIYSPNVND